MEPGACRVEGLRLEEEDSIIDTSAHVTKILYENRSKPPCAERGAPLHTIRPRIVCAQRFQRRWQLGLA